MACCRTFVRRDHSHLFIFKQQIPAILENYHQFEGAFFSSRLYLMQMILFY